MKIKNNITNLTGSEKEALRNAKNFVFVYGVGLIMLTGKDNQPISWDCSNSVAAKNYLSELKIPELT